MKGLFRKKGVSKWTERGESFGIRLRAQHVGLARGALDCGMLVRIWFLRVFGGMIIGGRRVIHIRRHGRGNGSEGLTECGRY